jgi:hypothetical protein
MGTHAPLVLPADDVLSGLGALLDAAAVGERVREAGSDVDGGFLFYLKYKFWTSCVAAYEFRRAGSGERVVYYGKCLVFVPFLLASAKAFRHRWSAPASGPPSSPAGGEGTPLRLPQRRTARQSANPGQAQKAPPSRFGSSPPAPHRGTPDEPHPLQAGAARRLPVGERRRGRRRRIWCRRVLLARLWERRGVSGVPTHGDPRERLRKARRPDPSALRLRPRAAAPRHGGSFRPSSTSASRPSEPSPSLPARRRPWRVFTVLRATSLRRDRGGLPGRRDRDECDAPLPVGRGGRPGAPDPGGTPKDRARSVHGHGVRARGLPPGQVVVDGESVGLLDFDRAHLGSPCADVGAFAHLHIHGSTAAFETRSLSRAPSSTPTPRVPTASRRASSAGGRPSPSCCSRSNPSAVSTQAGPTRSCGS